MDNKRLFKTNKTTVKPKTINIYVYSADLRKYWDNHGDKTIKATATITEQARLILAAVLNKPTKLMESLSYSAVYLVTPLFIPPFASVIAIWLKL